MDAEQTREASASAASGWDTYYKVIPNVVTPKVKSDKCSKPLPDLTYNGFKVNQQPNAQGKTLYSVSLPVPFYPHKTVERYELAMLHQEIDNWVEQNF